ncbi:mycothiol conjugate amidase Mca [Actinospongicola halichondriae]|uniref:mycothiol conjugate amidase Mca n=1 Tax=Actinospongicola halichondriae TaxID=3236844 RepID=UPI003D55A591
MTDRCLLTVHAHPDDESSKGAGSVARYHRDGVRTVLVCCTGGEEGDILNPAMDRPEVRADLEAVRRQELDEAARIIGYDEVVMLGYRDSGMPDSEANARPEAFANAPLDEAVGRLVAIIRREKPQVVVTYGDDQKGYPHPDHLMVHDVTMPAVEKAADPDAYPEAGEPHQVAKVYWTTWSRARMLAMHEKFQELGLESPFDESWFERESQDHRITTRVSTEGFGDVRWDALLAHATQVDPTSPFWFGLPREVAGAIHPWDEYVLAVSHVESDESTGDLFDGVA